MAPYKILEEVPIYYKFTKIFHYALVRCKIELKSLNVLEKVIKILQSDIFPSLPLIREKHLRLFIIMIC